jgi:predicted nucleic acid-binding protein
VFSWATGPRAERARWKSRLDGVEAAVAFATIAEVHYGAYKGQWGMRRLARLEQDILDFSVLTPDDDVFRLCGWLRGKARRAGHPLQSPMHANDLWIASCAIRYDLPLLTANIRHFAGLPGLRLAE